MAVICVNNSEVEIALCLLAQEMRGKCHNNLAAGKAKDCMQKGATLALGLRL
jgi:hypothetical protein